MAFPFFKAYLGDAMKETTLRLNKEFRRLYYRGSCAAGSSVVVYALENRREYSRLGITTGKKVGNAVKRSRARRVIRAAYAALSGEIPAGYDFVIVARSKTPECKSTDVAQELRWLLPKATAQAKNRKQKRRKS